jgi:hypothetical protein
MGTICNDEAGILPLPGTELSLAARSWYSIIPALTASNLECKISNVCWVQHWSLELYIGVKKILTNLRAAERLMLFAVMIAIKGAGNRLEHAGDCIAAPRCSFLHPSLPCNPHPQFYLKLLIAVHASQEIVSDIPTRVGLGLSLYRINSSHVTNEISRPGTIATSALTPFGEELHKLCSSPNIPRMIQSRRMRWAGHVVRMGGKRNAYNIFVRKPEGKIRLGRHKRRR